MQYVERSVIIVRPQQPFADWANSVDTDMPRFNLEDERAEPNAYLVDTQLADDLFGSVLLAFHGEFFLAPRAGYKLSYQMAPIGGSRP
ncbi:MAG: hypothetical protein ACYC26_15920 [Phycisphaerales bacterium]